MRTKFLILEKTMRFNLKFLVPIVLLSVLVSGCNQPRTTAQTSTEKTTSVASAKSQSAVKQTDTAQALLTVLSGLMVKSLNENPKQPLSTQQQKCLLQSDQQALLPTFQRYLQGKLTAEELTKTNQYYALPVGQKQIRLASQQLRAVKGEAISEPVSLTDDEKLQMQAFQTTPEGKKLAELLSPKNQPELEIVLTKPMMAKVTVECHINVAKLVSPNF